MRGNGYTAKDYVVVFADMPSSHNKNQGDSLENFGNFGALRLKKEGCFREKIVSHHI